jgi:hypothetical protein
MDESGGTGAARTDQISQPPDPACRARFAGRSVRCWLGGVVGGEWMLGGRMLGGRLRGRGCGGRAKGGGEREVLDVFQGSVCYADDGLSCA